MIAHNGGNDGRRGTGREGFPVHRLPVSPARPRPVRDETALDADQVLRDAVTRARRLTEEEPEPFRSLAFTAVLDHLLHAGATPATVQSAQPAKAVGPPSTDVPIAEFLAQRRLDSHPDRVVAIAYYHFHHFDGQGVTTKDLAVAYGKARAKRPQNYPDVIASCVRKGYVVDGGRRDGMKTWIITGTGEAHVEQDM
jgi:hypothetical protein